MLYAQSFEIKYDLPNKKIPYGIRKIF